MAIFLSKKYDVAIFGVMVIIASLSIFAIHQDTNKQLILVTVEICDRSISEILGPMITEAKGIPSTAKRKYLFRAVDISNDAIKCSDYRNLNPQDIIYCPSGNSEPEKKDLFLFSDVLPDPKIFRIVKWK